VVLAAQAGTVDAGGVGECVVLIRNTADEHDEFDVLVHGPAAVWATVDPPHVSLDPGVEVPVWVRFAVPRDPFLASAPVDYAVTVSSRNDPSWVHAERGELSVRSAAPTPRLSAALDVVVDDGRTVIVPVRLANAGGAPVNVSVGVRDVAVDSREAVVPAGGSVEIDFDVPRKRGVDRVTVDVTSDTGDGVSLTTSLPDEHRAVRRDLARSAAVLGGLLVAAFIAVALLGDREPERSPLVTVAPSASTTAPEGATSAPVAVQPSGAAESTGATSASPAKRTPAAAPADLPALVFVRWYGPGDRDLVVRGPGRTGGELRLRSAGTVESSPDLSPDGTNVAYVEERGGAWRLCVIASVGGAATCSASVDATSSIAWKPDASAIYAARASKLIEVPVDGSGAALIEPLTHDVAVPGGRFSLSPDGTRVAVVDGGRIVIRPIAGGDGLSLRVPASPEDPTWTPAGDRIVYTSDTQLYSAPLGDGPVRQLTADGTVNGDATVAGGWVVFRSNRSGTGDLYAIAAGATDGNEDALSIITRASERDTEPST
jgi:hypothetical protein